MQISKWKQKFTFFLLSEENLCEKVKFLKRIDLPGKGSISQKNSKVSKDFARKAKILK